MANKRGRDYRNRRGLPNRLKRDSKEFYAAFDALKRNLDSLARRFGAGASWTGGVALNKPDQEYPRGEEFSSPWRPFMDLTDQGDHYLLWVDLPGVLKEDCDLRVYDERLILEGERKCSEVEEQDRLRSERFFGTFSRELRLPPDVDTDRVSAEMQEGVLTVKLPKSTDLKAREVEIR